MPTHCRLVGVAALAALLIIPSGARGSTIGPLPYQDEGFFVEAPGAVGGVAMAVPGTVVGGAVCLPYAIFDSRSGFGQVLGGCAFVGGIIAGLVGYTVVGAPFYAVKKVTWDWPKKALGFKDPAPDEQPATPAPSPPPVTVGVRGGLALPPPPSKDPAPSQADSPEKAAAPQHP